MRGGLPPFFLAGESPEREFQEWVDSYWAKDIQELFHLERRSSFQKFFELLLARSGGIFEATKFAAPCEVSRVTIANYLKALEATLVVHIVRPFSGHRPTEIISAPKAYAFDTGFVCYYRGWERLRPEDHGLLWEHFVLNELQAHGLAGRISYWRDKSGHEVDFILASRKGAPIAAECKWSAEGFDPANLRAFRRTHPGTQNFAVVSRLDRPFSQKYGDLPIRFVDVHSLIRAVSAPAARLA